MPMFSIESLDIIDRDIMTVRYHDPAISALDSITLANIEQTAVAVVDNNSRLIGEISASTLAYCDEDVAAPAMRPFQPVISWHTSTVVVLRGPVSSSSSASSCSSDDESGLSRYRSGRYSFARRSEAITCYPGSSLVAVLIQALAHRANSVWVIDEDLFG
ncbi:hypothetical protein HAX54_025923 [Datura stramonium]|uniref:CBS domain-containing protein n=1 Tax=Datura stramonium TaxID=4076 RepID=A0ABS8V0E4_DATST|nr:hypothetical protein [Datura stramonium]